MVGDVVDSMTIPHRKQIGRALEIFLSIFCSKLTSDFSASLACLCISGAGCGNLPQREQFQRRRILWLRCNTHSQRKTVNWSNMPSSSGYHIPSREFRDPVHGFVKLSDAEVDIVNSTPFQRLRDIRQLAMGHMVYPGANHTRFEHSLGCLHLSTQIMDLLVARDGAEGAPTFDDAFHARDQTVDRGKQILRLAALLHDVGHPPFSHSGEDLLPPEVDHEQMTVNIIRETEIAELIERHYSSEGISVEDVIVVATSPEMSTDNSRKTAFNLFLNQILTGELGADRIDYLLRDARHSGQPSGEFDYLKLINAMTLVNQPVEEGEAVLLGLDQGGWLVAEQMVVSRYLMYIALYFHKTKRIYERHLTDFMREHLPKGRLPSSVAKYLALSDTTILERMAAAGQRSSAKGHQHAKRFINRSHLRMAKEVILADNYIEDRGRRIPNKIRFDKLQEHVRVMIGSASQVAFDTPDHTATKMFASDSKILVRIENKPRYLDEISEVVRGMSSKIWRGRVYCEKGHEVAVRAACDEFLQLNPPDEETKR